MDEAKLMELFKTCHQCGTAIKEQTTTQHGSQIKMNWTCQQGHSGEWESGPDQRQMGCNNILTCAAILFTGATFTDIKDWAQHVNLQLPSKSQYYAIQSKYLIPAVNDAYNAQIDKNIEHVRELSASGQKVDLGGDARCDSPGMHNY